MNVVNKADTNNNYWSDCMRGNSIDHQNMMDDETENTEPNKQPFSVRDGVDMFNPSINGTIDYEAKQISTKEEELLKKARELENEMKAIR